MPPLIIGLTGGLASGKSTVAALFQDLGVPVIDADAVARETVAPGEPALAQIRQLFGPDLILSSGELDRPGLRKRIFADPVKRRRLERILHPEIHARILRAIEAITAPYVIVMIPLLVESRHKYPVQRVLVVDVPREMQISRAKQRDGSEVETLNGILAAQASREKRLAQADDIIENTGNIGDLRARIHSLHRDYLDRAAHHARGSDTPLADNSE